MQEEVENRAVTLVISATKLTARLLKAAILKYLASRKEKSWQSARCAGEAQRQADGEAAHRAESGRVQHRDHRQQYQIL